MKSEKVWKSLLITSSLLLLTFSVARAAATPVQELYPFDVVGRIVNAENVAYDASAQIMMQARNTDGKILAQTSVRNPSGLSPWNFVLSIPVSSAQAVGYAVKGGEFQLSAKFGNKVYSGLVADGTEIGTPGDKLYLKIMLAEDANGNGIADSYEESMLDEMWYADIEGDYDPDADYDGDGQSNRNEYLAGTDPFDKDDCFRASALTLSKSEDPESPELFAVTFEANAGRSYGVVSSPELTETADGKRPDWQRTAFRLSRDDPHQANVSSLDARTWEVRTVYLLRQGDQRFFKVVQELDE